MVQLAIPFVMGLSDTMKETSIGSCGSWRRRLHTRELEPGSDVGEPLAAVAVLAAVEDDGRQAVPVRSQDAVDIRQSP